MTKTDTGMGPPETIRFRRRIVSAIAYGIVLVVALAALAGAFWTWREGRATRRETGRIGMSIGQINGRLEKLSRQMVPRVEWLRLKARLDRERTREFALEQRLGALEGRVASDREQVALQGASLLLHVGARLASLEPETHWVRGLLVTVHDLLAPWPSARLLPLRRLLTADIQRLDHLSQMHGPHPGSVLAALALASPHWPLMLPHPPPPRIRRPAVVHGFWARIGGWITRLFGSLVRIRTLPERVPPPPGSREAARLRLRLALDLALARINWFSGRREQYQADLVLLHRFILRHYESRDPVVTNGLDELSAIQHPPLPLHWAPLLAALRAVQIPVVAPVRASP